MDHCGYKKLMILLCSIVTAMHQTTATSSNSSEFPGKHSGSRLAYYRWRLWLRSRLAVQQKVPPLPTMPSTTARERLAINASFTVATVFLVDASQQTVQLSGRLMLTWFDPALAVDQNLIDDFTDGNSTLMPDTLTIPANDLWLPNIIIVEEFNTINLFLDEDVAKVLPNGSILMTLPRILTVSCRLIMTGYPFDEHHCPFTLFDASSNVDIFPFELEGPFGTAMFTDFAVSGEWELLNVTERTTYSYLYAGYNYLKFVLHLRRKTTFYSVVMLFPMVLTSYLNVLVFLLPPDLGDKASYLVTLTVSMSVYAAFFNSDMPRGLDSMPRIFVLLMFVYVESVCILLMCLAVLKKYAWERENPETEAILPSCSPIKNNSICPDKENEEHVKKAAISTGTVSAKQLDRIFFLSTLFVNTMGIGVILATLTDEI